MGLKGALVLPDNGLPLTDAYMCISKHNIIVSTNQRSDNIRLIAEGVKENNMPPNVPIGIYQAETWVSVFATKEARDAEKEPLYRHLVQVAFNDMEEYVEKIYDQLKLDFPNLKDC